MTTTRFLSRLRRRNPAPAFRPASLTEVLLSMTRSRKHKPAPLNDPNWEDEMPMSGLS